MENLQFATLNLKLYNFFTFKYMNAALENAFSALTREGEFIIYYLSCLMPWRLKLTIQICYRVSVFLELKPWFQASNIFRLGACEQPHEPAVFVLFILL